MKKFDFYSKKILLIIVLLLATSFTLSAQQTTTGVAIMKAVDEIGDVSPGVKLTLRGTLAYAINHMPGYEAYTRVNFSSISEEQKFQRSGHVDDNQIKEIGKATGAKYILVAEVANYDESHITITASIIDIESTKLRNTADPVIAPIDPEEMKVSCIKIARSLLDIKGSLVSNPDKGESSPTDSDGDVPSDEEVVEEVFSVVENDPEFPGGMEALYKYLSANIQYPALAKENNITGKVWATFVVEKDGSIGYPRILRSIPVPIVGEGFNVHDKEEYEKVLQLAVKSLDMEVLRVVREMPKWKPGKQRGKAVRVSFNLPVEFNLY